MHSILVCQGETSFVGLFLEEKKFNQLTVDTIWIIMVSDLSDRLYCFWMALDDPLSIILVWVFLCMSFFTFTKWKSMSFSYATLDVHLINKLK